MRSLISHHPCKFAEAILWLTAGLFLAGAAHGSLALSGDNLELTATGATTYDSNLTDTAKGKDDVFFTLTPRANYQHQTGIIKGNADVGIAINRYVTKKVYDKDNIDGNLSVELPATAGYNYSGAAKVSYVEAASADPVLHTRVNSKTFSSTANGLFNPTSKQTITGSIGFQDSQRDTLSSQQSWNSDVNFLYRRFLYGTGARLDYAHSESSSNGGNDLGVKLNQQTDQVTAGLVRPLYAQVIGRLSYGYSWVKRSNAEQDAVLSLTGQTAKQEGSVFQAELLGPFLPQRLFPKLKSSLLVSYSQSAAAGLNDAGGKTLQGSVSLGWQAREATLVHISAEKARLLAANDLSTDNTNVNLGATEKIGSFMTADASVGYEWNSFLASSRSTEGLIGHASLTRTVSKAWSTSLAYDYRATTSAIDDQNFSHHLVTVSVTATF